MLGDLYNASEVTSMRVRRAEHQAADNWRFRKIRTKQQVLAASVITSVLGLFLR